jgi:CheY-like chemotaxis protein
MTKAQRHPPSRELWRFCMDRLRELRGADTRERDLANLLGFEHSRAVRWKEGQMYVDRAEYLVRLADALEVDTMTLVALAAGTLSAEQAARPRVRAARGAGDARRGRAASGSVETGVGVGVDVATDVARFAIDPTRFDGELRGLVLLVAPAGEGPAALGATLRRQAGGGDGHAAGAGAASGLGALVATSFSLGLCLAERHRPDLVFLDLGLANMQAFDACHVLSGLTTRSQRKCRVVGGTAALTPEIERGALMAGAASVALYPFAANLYQSEIARLSERLTPRRAAKEVRRHV